MAVTQPVDIVNRALDECGCPEIADLYEGSPAARAALRIYDSTLRQMFAAANWNFARKQDVLVLMADISGVLISNVDVPLPWQYMYGWPVDCVHARWVPWVGCGTPTNQRGSVPFIVTSVPRLNPVESSWDRIEGHDPDQTRVILTDQAGSSLVYTGLLQYPDAWDPLFEEAMVATLAARLAMPCVPDKGAARQIRSDNLAIAREALVTARVRDGNEGWTIMDHTPDWISARTSSRWDSAGGVY